MTESEFAKLLRIADDRESRNNQLTIEKAIEFLNRALFAITPEKEDFQLVGAAIIYADDDRIILKDSKAGLGMFYSGYVDGRLEFSIPEAITLSVLQNAGILDQIFDPLAIAEFFRLQEEVVKARSRTAEDLERAEYERLKKKFENMD